MEPIIYLFDKGCCKNTELTVSINTNSWVYFWVDVDSSKVVYVGEYGKSETYTLVTRLRRSIGELSHNTMNQLQKNSVLTSLNIDSELAVYCYQLACISDSTRKEVESWCNWLVTTNHILMHEKYCGFSFGGVSKKTKVCAANIYKNLSSTLARE